MFETKKGKYKQNRNQHQVNMVISQRTFVFLILLFGLSNVRCETNFKSGEHKYLPFVSPFCSINSLFFHSTLFFESIWCRYDFDDERVISHDKTKFKFNSFHRMKNENRTISFESLHLAVCDCSNDLRAWKRRSRQKKENISWKTMTKANSNASYTPKLTLIRILIKWRMSAHMCTLCVRVFTWIGDKNILLRNAVGRSVRQSVKFCVDSTLEALYFALLSNCWCVAAFYFISIWVSRKPKFRRLFYKKKTERERETCKINE